ncbi:hypothetical protein TNCV_4244871 [Trichonephila clavipes]|nr:hypothetical protein TNCV_4244871 [Trichonephila clavipes]
MAANHRIANIPEDGKDPDVICLTVYHLNLLTTPSRANRYINKRLHLKSHLPGSMTHLCGRGKFCHLAQGGLIVVKGLATGKFLKSWDFLQYTWKCCPISGMTAPCLTTCTMRCMRIYPSAPWPTDLRDTCSILRS